MTLIDRDPLIKEYQEALKWLEDHMDELDLVEYATQTAAVSMAMQILKQAPVRGGILDENGEPERRFFDVIERHENCTVEILRDRETGEESWGWYEGKEKTE